MSWGILVDIVLVLILISALVFGYRNGLARTVFGLAGLVAGTVATYFLLPLLTSWIPGPLFRAVGIALAIIILLTLGYSIGSGIGGVIRNGINTIKLGPVDRVLGSIVNVAVTAVVVALLTAGITWIGVPGLAPAVASSTIVRTVDSVLPEPATSFLASVRGWIVQGSIPVVVDALGGPTVSPSLPGDAATPAVTAASASVVRVSGTAFQCGSSVSGSGFVVSPGRVITNAHVVAGVPSPTVEAPNGAAVSGRVVYFDQKADIAVVRADGLPTAPLPLTETSGSGARAFVAGYPLGGPLKVTPAQVITAGPLLFRIGDESHERNVYTLAATVQQGNSGGPVLSPDGAVNGLVFASGDVANVGFALTMAELGPVAQRARSLTEPVNSGSCMNH